MGVLSKIVIVLKASSQSEFSKRVLKASSQSEFSKRVLKASFQSEFSKRVLKTSSQSKFSKRVLKASLLVDKKRGNETLCFVGEDLFCVCFLLIFVLVSKKEPDFAQWVVV
jgi:ribosomal protein S30